MGNLHTVTRMQAGLFMTEHGISALSGKVLDVGCGSKPYKRLMELNKAITEWVGMDVRPVAEVVWDLNKGIPLEDESFDSVLCNDVLQFVVEPVMALRELRRVTKVGGTIVLTVPMCRQEDGHELWGFKPNGMMHIANGLGLEVVHMESTSAVFKQEGENFLLQQKTGTPMDLGLFRGWLDYLDKKYPSQLGLVMKRTQ